MIGTPGVAADASTTRVGAHTQAATYVGGIYQKAVNAGTLEVTVTDSVDKMGTITIAALKVLLGLP
jgi:hypothetical protein